MHWAFDSIFYHIYPLGMLGAPYRNDFTAPPVPRLEGLYGWLDHLVDLGVNALYLGPVFEATSHGYDTADYYHVDRRLGTDDLLRDVIAALHGRGIRVILDGVFNHVGRDFWAFRDVRAHGEGSAYRDWFAGLRFDARSPKGDPFTYDCWDGHFDLPKLNLHHPAVRRHLLGAVGRWMAAFGIDGLRLDAADVVDMDFLRALAAYCREQRPDFWLMGEVVHGDYRRWANPETLDATTNYECYKGLYSSLVDANYFEVAYALNRQFGAGGLYRDLPLYAFADNHDVNRVASSLQEPAHLYPLYCLLMTMPGVPSIYYGSEWGFPGEKTRTSDRALRPAIGLDEAWRAAPHPDLVDAIRRLTAVRRGTAALRYGSYQEVLVKHEQFVFARQTVEETIVVALNAAAAAVPLTFRLPAAVNGHKNGQRRWLTDLLNPVERFPVEDGQVVIDPLYPTWARIMRLS